MNRKDVNNPHDKYFKAIMADKDLAIGFLSTFLPEGIKALIDLDEIELQKDSYIDDDLNEIFSDALFKCSFKNELDNDLYISVLIEHKSYPDKFVSVQVLDYLSKAYRLQANRGEELIPIIPIIYYHGKESWKLKALTDLFKDYSSSIHHYLPSYQTIFVDLSQMSDETLDRIENVMLGSALITHKYSSNPSELLKQLRRIIGSINYERKNKRNFLHSTLVYISNIIEIEPQAFIAILGDISEPIKNEFMTTYQLIKQEGIKKGIEKGIEKGMEKGMEKGIEQKEQDVIIKGHQKGATVGFLADITGLSIEEVDKIIKDSKS